MRLKEKISDFIYRSDKKKLIVIGIAIIIAIVLIIFASFYKPSLKTQENILDTVKLIEENFEKPYHISGESTNKNASSQMLFMENNHITFDGEISDEWNLVFHINDAYNLTFKGNDKSTLVNTKELSLLYNYLFGLSETALNNMQEYVSVDEMNLKLEELGLIGDLREFSFNFDTMISLTDEAISNIKAKIISLTDETIFGLSKEGYSFLHLSANTLYDFTNTLLNEFNIEHETISKSDISDLVVGIKIVQDGFTIELNKTYLNNSTSNTIINVK